MQGFGLPLQPTRFAPATWTLCIKWEILGVKPSSFLNGQLKASQRLKIEGVSTHSFRRTALTAMSDAGIPLRHIQAISGHRTLAALEKYLGVTEKQKQCAIQALDF